jgi:hypothetical protein
MGSAIVVGNKSQDALAQVHEGGPTGASEQAANQDREPDLNLVQPGTVPGSVDKANAMGRIREKGGSRLHRGQMTAFALDTEILLNATQLGYQTDQRFGLMRVELIGNEDPARMRIGLNGLYDVSGKVGFRAGGSNTGSHNLASGYIQIGDQTMACHAVHIRIPGAGRDQAAWARTHGDVRALGCRSSHRCLLHASPVLATWHIRS